MSGNAFRWWIFAVALSGVAAFDVHLVGQERDLRAERANLRAKVAATEALIAASERDFAQLENELQQAERQLADVSFVMPVKQSPQNDGEVSAWVARVAELKQFFSTRSDQRIPELQLLAEEDWVRVARAPFETEQQRRIAAADARTAAKQKFARILSDSLQAYMTKANGEIPRAMEDLLPFFSTPPDPVCLERYEVYAGPRTAGNRVLVRDKFPIDAEYDSRVGAGPNGAVITLGGSNTWGAEPLQREKVPPRGHD